ncbi:hypothetical protein [Ochrobactrum sp. BTU1]|uniref:hypothetical protein n=1 Tax=Ochrobactrum sp. BTU1 TaxID=2840456 RepID=UPI001C05B65F|nr:hypothetical protein KMS41_22445 [Ochrobactrum sp. BTU1]
MVHKKTIVERQLQETIAEVIWVYYRFPLSLWTITPERATEFLLMDSEPHSTTAKIMSFGVSRQKQISLAKVRS